jgi:hypothetical protein
LNLGAKNTPNPWDDKEKISNPLNNNNLYLFELLYRELYRIKGGVERERKGIKAGHLNERDERGIKKRDEIHDTHPDETGRKKEDIHNYHHSNRNDGDRITTDATDVLNLASTEEGLESVMTTNSPSTRRITDEFDDMPSLIGDADSEDDESGNQQIEDKGDQATVEQLRVDTEINSNVREPEGNDEEEFDEMPSLIDYSDSEDDEPWNQQTEDNGDHVVVLNSTLDTDNSLFNDNLVVFDNASGINICRNIEFASDIQKGPVKYLSGINPTGKEKRNSYDENCVMIDKCLGRAAYMPHATHKSKICSIIL